MTKRSVLYQVYPNSGLGAVVIVHWDACVTPALLHVGIEVKYNMAE